MEQTLYINCSNNNITPWLNHSLDKGHGGFFICLERKGKVFDTYKYMWLKYRQAWMLSTLYHNFVQNPEYLQAAKRQNTIKRLQLKTV